MNILYTPRDMFQLENETQVLLDSLPDSAIDSLCDHIKKKKKKIS